ncbi:DUF6226 family protein [Microterricola viridarii]|uniref:Uncharacterized protein n=1 Tax=Microterricola viridarii TaxID=412690 RepID=A0A1H1LLM5_9MICO|nr:DUF6226 family protein [Microterricola viridarii]SDR74955.1 hypothetical protein SAMN04489834_0134 [Microterricola viridarii]
MSAQEDLFDGPAVPMPEPGGGSFGWAIFSAEADAAPVAVPAPVRHVEGYTPFLAFAREHGVSPAGLAGDPLALLRFAQRHSAALNEDPRLRAAATVFLGNTIAALRTDANWRAIGVGRPGEVGAGRMSFDVGSILDAITAIPPNSAGTVAGSDTPPPEGAAAMLAEWAAAEQDDARDAAAQERRLERLRAWSAPQPAPSGAPRYTRPILPATDYSDTAGQPIPYGNRWGADGPDPDSYSRVSHPERFAGLHTVTNALIDYLQQAYAVSVRRESAVPDAPGGGFDPPLLHAQDDVVEVVRVVPESPDAAPLSFAFTAFPGVFVEAGVLHTFPHPICGCDACDDTVEAQAEELEELVLAVVNGAYAEELGSGPGAEVSHSLVFFDEDGAQTGSRSGSGGAPTTVSAERLAAASATLAALPHGWRAWPRRG